MSILRLAQSKTVASESASSYGVHFESDRYVLFKGSSYNPSDIANEAHLISSNLEIFSWSVGGGDEVIFNRITGATSNSGTVTIRIKTDISHQKEIIIDPSGGVGILGSSETPTDTRIKDTRHVHFNLGWSIDTAVTTTLEFIDIPSVTEDIVMAPYFNETKIEFDWSGAIDVNGEDQILKIHTHLIDPFTEPYTILCIHSDREQNTKGVNIYIDSKLIASYDADGNITVGPFGGTKEEQ